MGGATPERVPAAPKRRAPLLVVLGCIGCGGIVVAAVAVISYLAITGELTSAFAPSPFEGDGDFELVVATEPGRARDVMQVLVVRLENLGVDVSAEALDDTRVRLLVRRVRDGMEIANAVLPVRALAFYIVSEDQRGLVPPSWAMPAGVRLEPDYDGTPIPTADTREALAPLLAVPHAEHQAVVFERREGDLGGPPTYIAWLVEAPPVMTGADVADATVEISEWDSMPIVMLHFTADGGQRFADVTRANVHRKLAIVVDGESLSSPVIQEAITGGSAQITMGRADSQEGLRLEAEALSAALRSGALPAPCTLESVNAL